MKAEEKKEKRKKKKDPAAKINPTTPQGEEEEEGEKKTYPCLAADDDDDDEQVPLLVREGMPQGGKRRQNGDKVFVPKRVHEMFSLASVPPLCCPFLMSTPKHSVSEYELANIFHTLLHTNCQRKSRRRSHPSFVSYSRYRPPTPDCLRQGRALGCERNQLQAWRSFTVEQKHKFEKWGLIHAEKPQRQGRKKEEKKEDEDKEQNGVGVLFAPSPASLSPPSSDVLPPLPVRHIVCCGS